MSTTNLPTSTERTQSDSGCIAADWRVVPPRIRRPRHPLRSRQSRQFRTPRHSIGDSFAVILNDYPLRLAQRRFRSIASCSSPFGRASSGGAPTAPSPRVGAGAARTTSAAIRAKQILATTHVPRLPVDRRRLGRSRPARVRRSLHVFSDAARRPDAGAHEQPRHAGGASSPRFSPPTPTTGRQKAPAAPIARC